MGNEHVDTKSDKEVYIFKTFDLKYKNKSENNKVAWPKPRSGHRIVCDDVNVYSFGGYNPSLSESDERDLANDNSWSVSKPLFRELWKYNIASGIWSKLGVESIPEFLASNAVLLSGNILMVFGGTGVPFGANCNKDLYICDLSNPNILKFELKYTAGSCPPAQYGQAILLVDHYLYTVGGTTGYVYTCDIHRLDLKNGLWQPVYICNGRDNEPVGRYRHELAYFDKSIYVLGGGTAQEAYGFEVVFAFNLTTSLWDRKRTRPDNKAREAYPTPRRCHSCVQQDDFVFIIGGFTGHWMLKDIWRLDLKTLHWEKLPNFKLNRGVYFHSTCLAPCGKLITFGGIVQTENSSKRSADIQTAWLRIPKLKEICWEAVLSYCGNIEEMSEKGLLELGLPTEFIQRLDLKK